jgi:hypothetical protein
MLYYRLIDDIFSSNVAYDVGIFKKINRIKEKEI